MKPTSFNHLTDAQYHATQCQGCAEYHATQYRRYRDSRWFEDAALHAEWAAHYAERARRLMGVQP